MRKLRAGYTFDESAKQQANAGGHNYWWAYIEEILDRLGLCADKIAVDDLPHTLNTLSLLFQGGVETETSITELERWINSGGVLIACNLNNLDDLSGNRYAKSIPQQNGDFSISGEFTLTETEFTNGIHTPLHPDQPLLAASDLRLVDPIDSLVLAESNGHALITARKLGDGWVFYIGFDIAQTFWVIQQGRPIDRDYDSDGFWRTPDAIVIEKHEAEIAYTDELLFLLQNMVSVQPFPLIHRLPPSGSVIPDALFYYSGDDEGLIGDQLPAARFMAEHNLPYHMNCMAVDGKFGIDTDEIAELDQLGTELSAHYDFMDGIESPHEFTREDVAKQTREFIDHFGRYPICSVNHCCRWTGSAEPAIWMSEAGVSADGSFFSIAATAFNPVNNLGFSFGTSYPFHFWTGHTAGNKRLDFLELPATAYEMGYFGDQLDPDSLALAFQAAIHYQSTMSFFYHPIYIARYPACREAISHLLALIDQSGLSITHSAPDALVRWWTSRSAIRLSNIESDDKHVNFTASTPPGIPFIINIPLSDHQSAHTDLPHRIIDKFGRKWLQAIVPEGESDINIE